MAKMQFSAAGFCVFHGIPRRNQYTYVQNRGQPLFHGKFTQKLNQMLLILLSVLWAGTSHILHVNGPPSTQNVSFLNS